MNFVLTPHAIERFNQRIVPELTYDRAKSLLYDRIRHASPLKTKSINGQGIWKIEEPTAFLIGIHEHGLVVIKTTVKGEAEELVSRDLDIDPYDFQTEEVV
jgi:hypothetical protein